MHVLGEARERRSDELRGRRNRQRRPHLRQLRASCWHVLAYSVVPASAAAAAAAAARRVRALDATRLGATHCTMTPLEPSSTARERENQSTYAFVPVGAHAPPHRTAPAVIHAHKHVQATSSAHERDAQMVATQRASTPAPLTGVDGIEGIAHHQRRASARAHVDDAAAVLLDLAATRVRAVGARA